MKIFIEGYREDIQEIELAQKIIYLRENEEDTDCNNISCVKY